MSTVLTTERHRPSLRDSFRRLFARAPNGQSPSGPGMFDNAQNTRIQNATFTINQYGALAVDRPLPVTAAVAEGQIATESPPASSAALEHNPPPRPRRESPDVYVDCLMTESRGYPLWIPSPNRSLPILNRTLGVSIGDVGVLTLEGGFDFLFNIFHDATHPINAAVGVPDTFIPFTPAPTAVDIQQFVEWNAGSFLADASIDRVDDVRDRSTTILEATGTEGAVLMIPEDIHTTKLKTITLLRKYVKDNIAEWYRFVKHTLGHDIENGDLHLVYGCRKSSGFGIATAFNTGRRENTRLAFWVEESWTGSSRCPYRWHHTGSAEVKAGPPGEDNIGALTTEPIKNQCLFVNTIAAKVSPETWKSAKLNTVMRLIPGSTKESNNGERGHTTKPGASGSTDDPSSSPSHERTFHPSAILLDILEAVTPGLPAYIVCDDDWAPFVAERAMNTCDFIDQILENRLIVEDQGMLFFCPKNDTDLIEELGQRRGAQIRFSRIAPMDDTSNSGYSHWQAERCPSFMFRRLPLLTMSTSTLPHGKIGDANIPVHGGSYESRPYISSTIGKKKDKSKDKEADFSLSEASKISTSSGSQSITEMTRVPTPSSGQAAQMRKDKGKEKADERENDIIGTPLSVTAVLLGLVNEAAQFAPAPSLQNAASQSTSGHVSISELSAPALAVKAHWPSSKTDNNKGNNTKNNHDNDDHYENDHHDSNTFGSTIHTLSADPVPGDVSKGERKPVIPWNPILKAEYTAATSSDRDWSAFSDTDATVVSDTTDATLISDMSHGRPRRYETFMQQTERLFFGDDDGKKGQYEERPQPRQQAGRPRPRTDTNSTVTSQRTDMLKPPPLHRQRTQTTFGRPGPQRDDWRQRGSEANDDDEWKEVKPHRASGKGKAPQRKYSEDPYNQYGRYRHHQQQRSNAQMQTQEASTSVSPPVSPVMASPTQPVKASHPLKKSVVSEYQYCDASKSTADLSGLQEQDSDGVKKVRKGQITALAKMLSALRR